MKRNPFYRRNGRGNGSGIKERIIWQLQKYKREMSGEELSEIFRMSVSDFNYSARGLSKRTGVAIINVTPIKTKDGERDFLYSVERKPKLAIPKNEGQTLNVSIKSLKNANRLSKIKHIAEAKQRRELIARGEYISG
ncbi:hypothetical protein JHU04_002461 [Brenneria sp. 4F2]|nr:hypothetical protein [Brenneria bubanii]